MPRVRPHYTYTANPSKPIKKNFLDLRNMFSNQENIRIFFGKQENKFSEKNFLVPFGRKFDLNSEHISKQANSLSSEKFS